MAEEYIEVKKYRDSLEDKGFYGTYSKDNIRRFLTKKVNYLIEKAQNNLESKRFDLDSISYKTPSVINKKVTGTDKDFDDNLDIFDPGMATLFLTKIIRCCECCGVMATIALDNEHPRI